MNIQTLLFIVFGFVLSMFLSCAEKPEENPKSDPKAEVMKVHDDSMAEIGKLRNLVAELETKKTENPTDSMEIKLLINALENADEQMMQWMADYKDPEQSEAASYFAEQMQKIQKVAEDIYTSIDSAEKYLNE